jgi:YugN-like protein
LNIGLNIPKNIIIIIFKVCKEGSIVKFENTGIETVKTDLNLLDDLMLQNSLVRAGQWDYERVTYDRKFEIAEGTFYLRIMGYATDGDVGSNSATIQLLTPILGKHYYPHGVEYGSSETFPSALVNECEKILASLKSQIDQFIIAK